MKQDNDVLKSSIECLIQIYFREFGEYPEIKGYRNKGERWNI